MFDIAVIDGHWALKDFDLFEISKTVILLKYLNIKSSLQSVMFWIVIKHRKKNSVLETRPNFLIQEQFIY